MATLYSNYFVAIPATEGLSTVYYEDRSPRLARAGETVSFRATITGTPVTGDIWRFVSVPKGARLRNAEVTNTDLGTDVPGTLGWESTDADAFDTDVVLETAATTAVTDALIGAGPVTTSEDHLSITIGTVDTGASGTVTIIGSYVVPA